MAGFTLDKIIIENFRGINKLELDLNDKESTVLLGPNNSGKTTLLDAIGLCLASLKFYTYQVIESDFWKNESKEISEEFTISVLLKLKEGGSLPAVKGGLGDPIDVYGVKTVVKREYMTVNRHLLNSSGEVILLNKGTPISKAKKDAYKGMDLGGRRYARFDEVRDKFPEIWQLEPKTLYLSLYEWKSGPLQKLLKIYKTHLFSDEWTTPDGHKMPSSLASAYKFLNEVAIKTPFWEKELVPKFNEKLKNYLGSGTDASVSPSLSPIDSWIMSEFIINICPTAKSVPIDCKRLGDGWQSILRLIALEIVSELNDSENVILLMEEPETYLHPHLRKKLRKILSSLQDKGNQVFISTHSQEMVSFSSNQKIIRLKMDVDGIQKFEYSTSDSDQRIKDDETLFDKGNHEIVFANKVILTEGKGDQFAIRMGLEKNEYDCESESVSIVDCGSVNTIPSYAKICNSLGIAWFALHDDDVEDNGKRKHNTQEARDILDSIVGTENAIDVWKNDLEDVLDFVGKGKAKPRWINTKYGALDWKDIKVNSNLSKYSEIIETLITWLKK